MAPKQATARARLAVQPRHARGSEESAAKLHTSQRCTQTSPHARSLLAVKDVCIYVVVCQHGLVPAHRDQLHGCECIKPTWAMAAVGQRL